MKKKGLLRSKHVVATTMSNLGLELALRDLDLELFRAQVGDKYVLEQMIKLDANLGGEQSGHTILLDECPTGDGILTSIKMLEVMVFEDQPLSALVAGFKEFPQVLLNVRVSRKDDFANYPEIMETMESIQHELGNDSRMNVRYSGTEPLARVMIEGRDQDQIESLAQRMVSVISKHLG
jgi:phosphoglucosamine mutase